MSPCTFPCGFLSSFTATILEGPDAWLHLPMHFPSLVLACITYSKPAVRKCQEAFLQELDLYVAQAHHCIFVVRSECCDVAELVRSCCVQDCNRRAVLNCSGCWCAGTCAVGPRHGLEALRGPQRWLQAGAFPVPRQRR